MSIASLEELVVFADLEPPFSAEGIICGAEVVIIPTTDGSFCNRPDHDCQHTGDQHVVGSCLAAGHCLG